MAWKLNMCCVVCGKFANYIYLGKSLCGEHFEELKNEVSKAQILKEKK